MSEFEAATPVLSPMDCGWEYEPTSSEDNGSDSQSTATMPDFSPVDHGSEHEATSSDEDELGFQPPSPEEKDSDYQPPSSEEDESDHEPRRPPKTKGYIRIHQGSVTLNHHHLGDDTDLEVGTVISIGETLELPGGSFLLITELWKSRNGRTLKFLGHHFRPIEDFEKFLPETFGSRELVWLCEAHEHDPEPKRYLRSAGSKDVLRIRHLIRANPEYSFESIPQSPVTRMFTDTRSLVCRWKLVAGLSSSRVSKGVRKFGEMDRSKGKPKAFTELSPQELYVEGALVAHCSGFQHDLDSDPPEATSDDGASQPKRHGRATGRNLRTRKERLVLAPTTNGNKIAKPRRKSSYHLAMNLARMLEISSAPGTVSEQGIVPQNYTFADAFCGAGGMSIGARDAGLRIEWAFDEDKDAIKTYSLNHGQNACKRISAEEFLNPGNAYGTSKVDILHLSPPCQGFALACRGTPRIGDRDNRCMTYIGAIVKKVQPRIVTFEEVPEILHGQNREFFTIMVHNLTSLGYNIRWRTIACVNFGLPQKRRRLFVIASRRGEPLPDFPTPTHSHYAYCDELRLQPWNTFAGAIDSLEDSAPNHLDPTPRSERLIENWAVPHPPDWPFHSTITSGENWPDHYNGKYRCTVREAACLQGFPANYAFCGALPATKKQVVNAVPPPIAKAILEEVKRSLMRTDALRRS